MDLESRFGLRPFTRREALDAGLTHWQFHVAASSGRLHRFRSGVYCVRLAADDGTRYLQTVSAALCGRTDHMACSGSAVAMHQLPSPYFKWWAGVPVTIAGPRSLHRSGIRRATCSAIDSAWGPVTDLIDTAVTIAAELPLPQALIVTDAVGRRIAGTTNRFELASEHCRSEVRRRLTENSDLPALRLANPASESPAESFYRGHMISDGLAEPACGVPWRGASGKQYFIDLLLEGLAIEVDGKGKYKDLQILIDEKIREDDLRATGLEFHRPFVEDLYADPAAQMRFLHDKRAEIRRSHPWAS